MTLVFSSDRSFSLADLAMVPNCSSPTAGPVTTNCSTFGTPGSSARSASVTGCSPKLMATTSLASLSFGVDARGLEPRDAFGVVSSDSLGSGQGNGQGHGQEQAGNRSRRSATCHGRVSHRKE